MYAASVFVQVFRDVFVESVFEGFEEVRKSRDGKSKGAGVWLEKSKI